jgi:hypothetical protein
LFNFLQSNGVIVKCYRVVGLAPLVLTNGYQIKLRLIVLLLFIYSYIYKRKRKLPIWKKRNTHKILLVDDEPDILEIVGYNLTQEGYQILQP